MESDDDSKGGGPGLDPGWNKGSGRADEASSSTKDPMLLVGEDTPLSGARCSTDTPEWTTFNGDKKTIEYLGRKAYSYRLILEATGLPKG